MIHYLVLGDHDNCNTETYRSSMKVPVSLSMIIKLHTFSSTLRQKRLSGPKILPLELFFICPEELVSQLRENPFRSKGGMWLITHYVRLLERHRKEVKLADDIVFEKHFCFHAQRRVRKNVRQRERSVNQHGKLFKPVKVRVTIF